MCIDITPITQFHDGDYSETLVIYGGLSDTSTKILVPMDLEVYEASLDITGQHIENEPAMDIVMVNDISGSMNGSLGKAKADAKEFISLLLTDHTYNKAGLVSFETTAEIRKALTNDKQELFNIVDSYEIGDRTCIACGIAKGIEILRERGTPIRAMILMSNAHANWCTYGVCTPEMAKKQAVNKAGEAWYYGIKIYTIPYNEDSDIETLQKIANASNGKFYPYNTSMEDVYNDIEELFSGSPSDVVLDVGDDGNEEFSHSGEFLGTENVDFTSELQDLLVCECDGCEETSDECLIDLKVSSATTGIVILDNLMITGCLNQTCEPGETRLCPNQEGVCEGSYETCPEEGFWMGCDYNEIEGYEDPEETCDNLDNDCDGSIDDFAKSCYTGPSGTNGVGICHGGTQTCSEGEWGSCEGQVTPATESCNGVDDDCDGTVDEGCGGGGGRRGGGPSYYCGDGFVTGDEECERDEDCELFYFCEECICVQGCVEDWECSEWSECSPEGVKTRECADNNDCGTELVKPSESNYCEYIEGEEVEVTPVIVCGDDICDDTEDCESCPEDCGECLVTGGITGLFTGLQAAGILGLVALLIVLLLLFFSTKRKKKK